MSPRQPRVHQYLGLEYVEARRVLHAVQPRDVAYRNREVNEDVPVLHSNILKPARSSRLAAMFAHGMGETQFGTPVSVAPSRHDGYDFVLSWPDGRAKLFAAIELREVTVSDADPRRALTELLDELEGYEDASDLSIAVFMNRRGRFEYGPWLKRPDLPVQGVWLFGRLNAKATEWFVYGNLCRFPDLRTYIYPV